METKKFPLWIRVPVWALVIISIYWFIKEIGNFLGGPVGHTDEGFISRGSLFLIGLVEQAVKNPFGLVCGALLLLVVFFIVPALRRRQ